MIPKRSVLVATVELWVMIHFDALQLRKALIAQNLFS